MAMAEVWTENGTYRNKDATAFHFLVFRFYTYGSSRELEQI